MNYKPCKLFDASGDLSSRWFIFYYFRNPNTGKWHRIKHYISERCKNRTQRYCEARKLKKKIDKQLLQGYNPFLNKGKLNETLVISLENILTLKKESNRKRTYMTYRSYTKYFKNFLNTSGLHSITAVDFDFNHAVAFMDWILTNRKLSNRSYNNYLQCLSTLFTVLYKRQYISINPFSRIDPLPTEETSLIAFSKEELITMQTHLPVWNYNLYVAACLVFYCFLRPNEIMQLRVENLDLEGKRIIVPGSVSKNKKSEVVHLPAPMIDVLRDFDLNYPPNYYLFTRTLDRGSTKAHPERLREHWHLFIQQVGIRKTIYSLKHTAIGLAIDAGINLRDLQLQIRHSSLELTQKYADRFRRQPSQELLRQFPNLSSLKANRESTSHYPILKGCFDPSRTVN